MLTEVAVDKALIDSRQFALSSSAYYSTDMELTTQEGDVVTLSFQNAETYEGTEEQETYEDGSSVSEISITAAAASKYAIEVQGDLSDEELAAIEELSAKVAPIVEKFFSGAELDLEESALNLAESLGVIKEINLELEKTVTQSVSVASQSFSDLETAGNIDFIEGNTEVSGVDYSQVRNLRALADAVVTAEFQNQAAQFKSSEPILRSLGDLLTFIRNQFGSVLKPLSALGADFPEAPEPSKQAPEVRAAETRTADEQEVPEAPKLAPETKAPEATTTEEEVVVE